MNESLLKSCTAYWVSIEVRKRGTSAHFDVYNMPYITAVVQGYFDTIGTAKK